MKTRGYLQLRNLFTLLLIFTFFLQNFYGCAKPKTALELHAEGVNLYNKGKDKEALDVWHKELELDPKNHSTNRNIGLAYHRLGNLDMAMKYYKKSVELNPNYGPVYYSLGRGCFDLKDYDQAKTNFLKAIELNFSDADVYYNLGLTYKFLNNCE